MIIGIDLAASRRPEAMTRPGEAVLTLPWPIDLGLTVASHGWVYLAPWDWDGAAGRLARPERIGAELGTIGVTQCDRDSLLVDWAGFADADPAALLRRAQRWVSADWDPAPAIAALGPDLRDEAALVARGGGRMLRGSSFYEDFVKTVLTINTSWSSTCRMAAALVAEPGDGAFPLPVALLDYGERQLRDRAKIGFRAPTLIATTRRMLDDGVIDAAGDGIPERLGHDYLTGLKGIGPYAAAHCRMLLHDFSRLPVDSAVTAYLRDRHGHDPAGFATSRASCGNYLALGYRLTRLRERLAGAPEG